MQVYAMDKKLGWLESSTPDRAASILRSLLAKSKRVMRDMALHVEKEERALFVILEKRLGHDGEPVLIMRNEHVELLNTLGGVTGEIRRMLSQNDLVRTWDLVSKLQGLRAGLSDHVSREERVLFWLAEIHLSELDRRRVSYDLARAASPDRHTVATAGQ